MTAKQQSARTKSEIVTPNEQRQQQLAGEAQQRQKEKLAKQKAADRRKIPVTRDPEEEIASQRQAPVTKAVNTTPALLRTIRNQNIGSQPPPNVAGNARLLQIWENSTDEERRTAMLILQLDSKMAATDIEGYFRFGEEWEKLYPREDKSRYDCGRETVKKGAILGGTSSSRVYQILATLKAYTHVQYQELAAKARTNGITIRWTHLRVIAWRLGKSEHRAIRRKVEQELVKRQFTESQLNKRIDELAPSTVSRNQTEETRTEQSPETNSTDRNGKTLISAIVSGMSKVVPQYRAWVRELTRWESEYRMEDREEIEAAFNTVSTLLHQMQETRVFIDQAEGILEQMQSTVGFYAKQADESQRKQKQEELAARINERVAAEKAHAKTPLMAKKTHLPLTHEFSDDESPRTCLRDEQDGEGDNDEFSPVEDGEEEWEESTDGDYDEEGFEDVDENDDNDLFTQSGDLVER